jgi:hypothetical protein
MHTLRLILPLLTACVAHAEILNWTNLSGGNWNTPANWSPNQVPSAEDTAVITNAGVYTVTLNANPTLAGLVLGGGSGTQTLATAGYTLALNGPCVVGPNGQMLLSGGALSGAGGINLEGLLTWRSGSIDTNAAVTVAAGGQIAITSGGVNYAKTLYGSLTNAGVVVWQPTGALIIGGTLHNLADGVFELQADNNSILNVGSDAVIINDGVFRKTGGGGTINCYVSLGNNGTVDTQTGTLNLSGRSSFNEGCVFAGAGATRLTSAVTNTLNGSVSTANLVLAGATLAGQGILHGTLRWESGVLGPDATLTVAADGELLIGSSANYAKNLYGNLTNAGKVLWQPTGGLGIGGTLHNLAGGVFDTQYGSGTLSSLNPDAVILNDGVFRKSAVTGTTTCNVRFINSGTVDVQTGVLTLPGGSALCDGGAFTGAGETRMNSGTNTIAGTVSSANLVLAGATLEGAGMVVGSFTWSSGAIAAGLSFNVTSESRLTIGSGANFTKFLNGNLTNAGTVVWLPLGSLLLSGVLHNQPGGLFDVQTDSRLASNAPACVIINEGIFRKSSGAGTATLAPMFHNTGAVQVLSGTLLVEGDYTHTGGGIALASGTFRSPRPLVLEGGSLTGWGTVWADVTNAAVIHPAPANGGLTINGRLTQRLGGSLEFELGGNQPGINQSRLSVTGATVLRGAIGVGLTDGYLPEPGVAFQVLSFASRKGEFCCFDNCYLLGEGRRLLPVYGTASFALATSAAPEPDAVPLRATVDGDALICWPREFTGYELGWSTNLSETNWTRVSGVTNRHLETAPLSPGKFFRLTPSAP